MSSSPNTDADPDVAIRYFTLGLNWAIHCCQNLSMKILRRPLADYVKNCTKKRAARLYFLVPPIKSLILWRCRGPWCRHFLNSLIINSDRVSLDLERAQSLRERNRKRHSKFQILHYLEHEGIVLSRSKYSKISICCLRITLV